MKEKKIKKIKKKIINKQNILIKKKLFNIIYTSSVDNIKRNYKNIQDTVNNIFDILYFVAETINENDNLHLDSTQKRTLYKNVIIKIIDTLPNIYTNIRSDEISQLRNSIDASFSLIEISNTLKGRNIDSNEIIVISGLLYTWGINFKKTFESILKKSINNKNN